MKHLTCTKSGLYIVISDENGTLIAAVTVPDTAMITSYQRDYLLSKHCNGDVMRLDDPSGEGNSVYVVNVVLQSSEASANQNWLAKIKSW